MKKDTSITDKTKAINYEPLLCPVRLNEDWVRFTRIYCKDGYIDKWMGDCVNDPNNDKISNIQLNSSSTYYRLNGKGKWIERNEFKQMMQLIVVFKETTPAAEIWNTAFNCA